MDVVQRAYAQLHDRFRAMTPSSRLTAVLLAALVVAGLGYLGIHPAARRPDADLLGGVRVTANQLLSMQAALGKANLKDYTVRDNTLIVPQGQESTYLAALSAAGALPPSMGDNIGAASNASSIWESAAQREERIRAAKQKEVGQAISMKPGIEQASVIFDVDKPSGFNKEKVTTAIVYVKPVGDAQLDEEMVLAIRYDVVGAYANLKPEDVTVSDRNGRTWRGPLSNTGGIGENRYRSIKRALEQDLNEKIQGSLAYIPNVTVALNVELDRGQNQKSNAATLTPVSARASIGVPSGYFRKVWESRNPASPGVAERTPDPSALEQIRIEETANIQRCVAALLPTTKNPINAADAVTVTTFQEISTAAAPSTDLAKTALLWIVASWKTLGGVALALIVLFVLRSSVRAKPRASNDDSPNAESKDDGNAPAVKTIREPAASAPLAAPHWRRRVEADDRSIRRELSALVEDDPETAASILRNWIGQVN